MNKQGNAPNQTTLILRLICGGYLVYTAWGLRDAFHESPLFIIAAIVFAVVGAALAGISLYTLIKTGGLLSSPVTAAEESTDEEPVEDIEEGEDKSDE